MVMGLLEKVIRANLVEILVNTDLSIEAYDPEMYFEVVTVKKFLLLKN